MSFTPLLLFVLLFIASSAIGVTSVKKMIQVREAKHELKHGSAGFLRSVAGWSFIAFWAMATWFVSTVLGDWQMSGDVEGALEHGALRLRVLVEIAIAMREE